MSKEGDYRDNARDSMELAARAAGNADKTRLLELAGKWRDLADDRVRRNKYLGPHPPDHPLVRAKFGPDTLEAD
jgi:hypothetical protein